ncbi:hypothetical protein RRG08_030381 [Elysia crispata]|uniref:Uncharacterized protein n=1 Tax=Elysia crispata TaxID=231223 RepID=A0AAE0YG57_9GAST|nr:hypothetical protein RRG08_030381 [Elysia crispata]
MQISLMSISRQITEEYETGVLSFPNDSAPVYNSGTCCCRFDLYSQPEEELEWLILSALAILTNFMRIEMPRVLHKVMKSISK